MTSSQDVTGLRHITEIDLRDDEHIRDLLHLGLPGLIGETLLAWIMADGLEPVPALSMIEDSPSLVGVEEAHEMVFSIAAVAQQFSEDPGVIIVWKRKGSDAPNDDDLAWLRAAPAACAAQGVRLLGIWLVAGNALPLRLDADVR